MELKKFSCLANRFIQDVKHLLNILKFKKKNQKWFDEIKKFCSQIYQKSENRKMVNFVTLIYHIIKIISIFFLKIDI